jgi:hypothetical protein
MRYRDEEVECPPSRTPTTSWPDSTQEARPACRPGLVSAGKQRSRSGGPGRLLLGHISTVRALKRPHVVMFVFSHRISLGTVARKPIAGVARDTVAVIARGQPTLEENVPTGTR